MPDSNTFWITFSAIAVTLAGFTLAGYSIYTTRAEMAVVDQVCRRYAFQEESSSRSLAFMFLALFMFLVPLLLSLSFLIRFEVNQSPSAKAIIYTTIVFSILFFLWISINVIRLIKYLYQILRYTIRTKCFELKIEKEKKKKDYFKKSRTDTKRQGRFEKWKIQVLARDWFDQNLVLEFDDLRKLGKELPGIIIGTPSCLLILVLAALFILGTLILLVVKLCHSWGSLLDEDSWVNAVATHAPSYMVEQGTQIIVLVSMIIGILLIYLHFHIFQPRRLLFKADQASLNRAIDDIENKCDSINSTGEWLRGRISAIDKALNSDLSSGHEWLKVRINFIDVALTSNSSSSKSPRQEHGLALAKLAQGSIKEGWWNRIMEDVKRKEYHIKWLCFLREEPLVSYKEILGVMNGIELYIEGLNRADNQLKEIFDRMQTFAHILSDDVR
jgi:hypothetical protein